MAKLATETINVVAKREAQVSAFSQYLKLTKPTIMLLVLLNGFFVAAEFAIIGVRPSKIDQMVQEGSKDAEYVQSILDSPSKQDRYIATAQLGITIASLGLGMYGEPKIAEFIDPYMTHFLGGPVSIGLLHTVSSIIALSLLTYLHVVLGEMVPKSISLSTPDRAVLTISKPMAVSQRILGIPVRILNGIGRLLLQVFHIPAAEGHARLHTVEEIELIVSESAVEGLLLEEEEEMIRNIFDFSEREAGQIMTPRPRVQAIDQEMPLDELLAFVTNSRHSRFPVYKEDLDHVVGILNLKDLIQQQLENDRELVLTEILRPAPAVPEDLPIERLLEEFKTQHIHMSVVLDEFGGLAGIVTLEDLVEEIVGEVRDEFDFENEPVVEIEPGVLEVSGSYLVDDLLDHVYLGDVEGLPDVETVGGLIHTWLGRPPQVGDRISAPHNGDVKLTVLDVQGLAVVRAKIEFPATSSEDSQ
ncbi:MAG: hemolysin family protein [Candidatus Promineifilaceae bacterium]